MVIDLHTKCIIVWAENLFSAHKPTHQRVPDSCILIVIEKKWYEQKRKLYIYISLLCRVKVLQCATKNKKMYEMKFKSLLLYVEKNWFELLPFPSEGDTFVSASFNFYATLYHFLNDLWSRKKTNKRNNAKR